MVFFFLSAFTATYIGFSRILIESWHFIDVLIEVFVLVKRVLMHSTKRYLIWKSTTKVGYLAFFFGRLISQMWKISTQSHRRAQSQQANIFMCFFLVQMHFGFFSLNKNTFRNAFDFYVEIINIQRVRKLYLCCMPFVWMYFMFHFAAKQLTVRLQTRVNCSISDSM